MERHTNPLYRRGRLNPSTDRDFSDKVFSSSRLAETETNIQPYWIKRDLTEKEADLVRHLVTARDLLREVLRLK